MSAIEGTSVEVRQRLVEALKLDLVGPWAAHEYTTEKLRGWQRPSNWYLTGFLIPAGTPPEQASDDDEDDDFELVEPNTGLAEESVDDRKAAKKAFFPSSMGLSFLVDQRTASLKATVRWGDYDYVDDGAAAEENEESEIESDREEASGRYWQRVPREEVVTINLPGKEDSAYHNVPRSGGLQLCVVERPVDLEGFTGLPDGHDPSLSFSSITGVSQKALDATLRAHLPSSANWRSQVSVR